MTVHTQFWNNMVRLACALLLLAVAASSYASESRIVGGTPAEIQEFPSTVQVQWQWFPRLWTQTCAGSILTSRWVLSTASCYRGSFFTTRFRRIKAGSTYRNTGGYIREIDLVRNHPSWEQGLGYDGDLALVRLRAPLVFSNVVGQTAIIRQGDAVPDGLPVVTAGWGVTLEQLPDIRATSLNKVTVLTVNNAQCAQNYANLIIPRTVTTNMICAGRPEGGAGACIGDTGGPLFVNDVLVGVTSWGLGCRNATFPRVYTAVSSYTNWIVSNAI